MTRLFEAQDAPRVFALPPGCDFIAELVSGLRARLRGQPPEAIARVRIYLNTQRAKRALQARLSAGDACLLPDIRVLSELAADPLVPGDLLPQEPALRRKLLLGRLVGALLDAQPELGPRTAMFELAESILKLLDEMDAEGIPAQDLDRLDVGSHAGHWARSMRFLRILRDTGMAAVAHGGEARLSAAVASLVASWAKTPPAAPVLVAGSTGSRGSTARFMRAVAALPQGAVILPGMDGDLPAPAWQAVASAPDHPQYGLARFAGSLNLDHTSLPGWTDCQPTVPHRSRLLSLALRPAPVTDRWFSEAAALRENLSSATDGVTLLEASGPQQEASAIALRLRGALADGKTAALVTPDRNLARRVGAYLGRWNITPDDSAGRPLPLTPPGTLLRLLADVPCQPLTPAKLLALLKHPLVGGSGEHRRRHLTLTRRLELELLRGGSPVINWSQIHDWAGSEKISKLMPEAAEWSERLCAAFGATQESGPTPLAGHLLRHRAIAEALSAGLDTSEPGPLWDKEAGDAACMALAELEEVAADGGDLDAMEYRALLASHFKGIELREEAFQPHPDLAIWGTLEARTLSAGIIILGGLNETVWPPQPVPEMWLNRAMRVQLGLRAPERRIGLSAHDFQQAAAAPEIVLSRAVRADGAPTVPSRWLTRLVNLISGTGESGGRALAGMRARGALLADQADTLDRLAAPAQPAPRPAPMPPVSARPTRLSVTRIETLIRDPYAIYARAVLGLRPLDRAGRQPDAKSRGIAVHAILEAFTTETLAGLPDHAGALFREVTARVLARDVPWPHIRRLWQARLLDIAPWFLRREAERRRYGAPVSTEAKGAVVLTGTPADFTLTAKADRIDLKEDGTLAIYDYKSGAPPSSAQVGYFAKQLLLEAIIADAGGFTDVGTRPVSALVYIGFGSGGRELAIDISPDIIARTRAELVRQITSYQSATTSFPARTRVQYLAYAGDFDQLSRLGEWRDGDNFTAQVVG